MYTVTCMCVCILLLLRTNMSYKWDEKSFICANSRCRNNSDSVIIAVTLFSNRRVLYWLFVLHNKSAFFPVVAQTFLAVFLDLFFLIFIVVTGSNPACHQLQPNMVPPHICRPRIRFFIFNFSSPTRLIQMTRHLICNI